MFGMIGTPTFSQAEGPRRSPLQAEMTWELRGDRWFSGGPRLCIGARVGSYRAVLLASHERGLLKRKARLTANLAQEALTQLRAQNPEPAPYLHRWEDDGGSVRGNDALALSHSSTSPGAARRAIGPRTGDG
jgi:hypothetical protein